MDQPILGGPTLQKAFVLINAEPGNLWKIADTASKVAGVKMAHAVTGEFDIILYAELDDMNQLGRLIETIQEIDGVTRTHTSVVIPPRVDVPA